MSSDSTGHSGHKPAALALLSSHRPRNVSWLQSAGLLFGDWGTSRLYVLGLAFLFAGRTSFYLICLMSLLILAVGWAYSQICRIYPDGGGVYTAAKSRSRTLAVIGALLLFADYTVTASLSVLDAFHYFGLPLQRHVQVDEAKKAVTQPEQTLVQDAGDAINTDPHPAEASGPSESMFQWDSPGLWAIIAIGVIGLFNLMGPKHTGGFAVFAAIGMVAITLLITIAALFSGKVHWSNIHMGSLHHSPGSMWVAFVSIVLALSGVEAIANLTGVMKKPVAHTARKAIFIVALEVAGFNIILALFMMAIFPLDRSAHTNDMLAYLTSYFVGPWGEWPVRIIGGLLLLSAGNTAITDMISVQYLMARDGELPRFMQSLNRFGVPWIPAIMAAAVPSFVLLLCHNLESLAALYAIGVVGAVAINISLCAFHPRLRRLHRKVPMMLLGLILLAIWVTLACTKLHALAFVTIVLAIGLIARSATKWWARYKGLRPSLLRQAIMAQLTPQALYGPKLLVGTYGSESLAVPALTEAKRQNSALIVCFIREVNLSIKWDERLSLDTDHAAQKVFSRFLDLAHEMHVPVIPVYDSGTDAAILMAENAAIQGASKILIGSSRQGVVYHLIKGHFQRRLESLLPPDLQVQVISAGASVDEPISH